MGSQLTWESLWHPQESNTCVLLELIGYLLFYLIIPFFHSKKLRLHIKHISIKCYEILYLEYDFIIIVTEQTMLLKFYSLIDKVVHPHSTIFKSYERIYSCLPPNSITPATHFPFSFPEVTMVPSFLCIFPETVYTYTLNYVLTTCSLFYIQVVAHYTHYLAPCFFHLTMYVGGHPTSLHKWCPSSLYTF